MASDPARRAARIHSPHGAVASHERRAVALSRPAAAVPAAVPRVVADPPVARAGRAVAFIPAGLDRGAWSVDIQAAAARRGLVVTTLCRRWGDVMRVLQLDPGLVLLLGTRAHLPGDLVVFADDDGRGPGQRRAERLSRPAEVAA